VQISQVDLITHFASQASVLGGGELKTPAHSRLQQSLQNSLLIS